MTTKKMDLYFEGKKVGYSIIDFEKNTITSYLDCYINLRGGDIPISIGFEEDEKEKEVF